MSIFKTNKIPTINNTILKTDWKPNNIPNIVFHGDSNSRNIISNNNFISSWLDSSGKMTNCIQTNNSKKPEYINNIINGFPVIHFNNTMLEIPLTLNKFTIFSVVKCFDNDTLYEFGDSSTGFYLNGKNNSISVNNGLTSIKKYNNSWLTSDWKILCHQYNGTHYSHNLYINGTFVNLLDYYSNINNPGLLNKTSTLKLGSKIDESYAINAYMSEYIVYNDYLSYDNIIKVTNYLNNKYLIY